MPLERGGSNRIGNLQVLCWSCNGSKKNRSVREMGAEWWGSEDMPLGEYDPNNVNFPKEAAS